MPLVLLINLLLILLSPPVDLQTPFEKSNGKKSATYEECIDYYKKLDAYSDKIKLTEYGRTSIGKPLHLCIISKSKKFTPAEIRAENKRVVFIINGIHPGEPDGIDASMMLARDLIVKPEYDSLLNHVAVVIVPMYNISGVLNRGCCSRSNQDGPEEYGFRANIQNLDLNRDFIKSDSYESQILQHFFTEWQPEILADTHVTDGADYQYTMTYIATQHNKLHPLLAEYETENLVPFMEQEMKKDDFEMCPYVTNMKDVPDSGIVEFLETPRYSTGYAALFNCIGFVVETHMLKPFDRRTISTYRFLLHLIRKTNLDYKKIGMLYAEANKQVQQQEQFILNWKLDTNNFSLINFKGYTAEYKPSNISGQPRLYYNRQLPYEKPVKFFNYYTGYDTVQKPKAYIVPQYCDKIISLMKLNGVKLLQLKADTTIMVEVYRIMDYKTTSHPYESHYLHSAIEVKKETQPMKYYKGDYVIYTNQPQNRYIVETLEPQGEDSFFAWNYFDGILTRKEGFSAYVWEDSAWKLLQSDAALQKKLENFKKQNYQSGTSSQEQLDFIYKHSPYFEKTFQRYPVGRLVN